MDSFYDSDDEDSHYSDLLFELSDLTRRALQNLTIASLLCPLEDSRIEKLQNELNQLKEQRKILEEEFNNTKRKRWCSWCLQEAVFQSDNERFYCCSRCEQLDILLSKEI